MLWCNFADLFKICAVVSCSYKPLFFHLSIYIYVFGQGKILKFISVITPYAKKWFGRQMAEDYLSGKF